MEAVIVYLDDWEALYVDGKCIDQDHSLSTPEYWVQWTNEFKLTTVRRFEAKPEDVEEAHLSGELPQNFKDLKGNYYYGD